MTTETAYVHYEFKKSKLKQFLNQLSKDELISQVNEQAIKDSVDDNSGLPLNHYLSYTEYPQSYSTDLAELVTMLLQKNGSTACVEKLMEHVLAGGSLTDFLKRFS